jgi:hypothetical protein
MEGPPTVSADRYTYTFPILGFRRTISGEAPLPRRHVVMAFIGLGALNLVVTTLLLAGVITLGVALVHDWWPLIPTMGYGTAAQLAFLIVLGRMIMNLNDHNS